jgi:hypothetical protein
MVSRAGLVRDAYESELPRVLAMVAAIWQLAFGVQVLAYLHEYGKPVVPVLVWAGLVVAALWLVPRTRGGELSGRDSAWAITIAVAAVALCSWASRMPGSASSVDWSIFGTSWLIAIVAVSRPPWEWVCGLLLVLCAHLVFSADLLGSETLGMTKLTASVHALAAIGIIFVAIRPTLRAQARISVRRASLASRSAAERAAVTAIREDRQARRALLEAQALPLLRDIAGGAADPADAAVRERCARQAAILRRSLLENAGYPSGLMARLEPALRNAGARGILVDVQRIGEPPDPGPAITDAVITSVESVLSQLPPHPVTLTIMTGDAAVEVYLTFSAPPRSIPGLPSLAGWHAQLEIDDDGAGCLEIGWAP